MNEQLIIDNIGLVYYVLKKLHLEDKQDLYEDVGMIGLVKAGKKFNSELGYKFCTFAFVYIQHEILRQIQIENYKKRKSNHNTLSLDTPIFDEQLSLYEKIPNDINIEKDFEMKLIIKTAYKILDILDEKDRFMMINFYGLYQQKNKTKKEIAEMLNMNQSTVAYRINRSLKIMKKILEDKYG